MKNLIHVIYPGEAVFSFVMENTLSPEDNLERVFAEWNHGSGMECKRFIESKKRSLSVNDIVSVNCKYYQCLSFGWKEVSVDYVNKLEEDVKNNPEIIHGPWFALNNVMFQRSKAA